MRAGNAGREPQPALDSGDNDLVVERQLADEAARAVTSYVGAIVDVVPASLTTFVT